MDARALFPTMEFDRNATMSGAKRRGSAGMDRRLNAAWVLPQAANTTVMSAEREQASPKLRMS